MTERQKSLAQGRISHLQSYFAPPTFQIAKAPRAIGSYGRETLVRWGRDIDVIVALADVPYWERYKGDSRKFLYGVRDGLNSAYPGTKVSSKEVAVRMLLSDDLQVDLVPSFTRDAQGGGFYIPNGSGGWRQTNPLYHDHLMATSNTRLASRLKPLAKLMKAWNPANGSHLRSFHLEMMVEHMWHDVPSIPSYPIALASTLTAAAGWASKTFSDPWDSSQDIDTYLTSSERALVVRILTKDGADAVKANAAEAAGRQAEAVALWDLIFARKSSAFH